MKLEKELQLRTYHQPFLSVRHFFWKYKSQIVSEVSSIRRKVKVWQNIKFIIRMKWSFQLWKIFLQILMKYSNLHFTTKIQQNEKVLVNLELFDFGLNGWKVPSMFVKTSLKMIVDQNLSDLELIWKTTKNKLKLHH